VALIGVLGTVIAAFIAVLTATSQIKKQFEHKVIYEGWKDFQEKLFLFSSALTNYSTKIGWLKYYIETQDNNLVNKGNKTQYRHDKWVEVINSFNELNDAYVKLLQSFETHEVIFLSLLKMKNLFQEEMRKNITKDYDNKFFEHVFPEIYGASKTISESKILKEIDKYNTEISLIYGYLEDFRNELQNITVGKILDREIPKRKPDPGYKILTKNGFYIQKKSIVKTIRLKLKNFFLLLNDNFTKLKP